MTTLIFDIEANNLMPKVNRLHCLAIKDADTGKAVSYTHLTLPTKA